MTLEWINETGALGLDVMALQTRALLVLWGQMSGSSPLSSYGPPQDVLPEWTTRDGIMLHAFSVWWNASHASKISDGQGNIAVVQPDQAHLVALTQWAAEAGAQVPPLQVLDFGASRALLVLWGKTDGISPEVLADYGVLAEDASPSWTPRDTKMLQLFQNWWNESGKGGTLPTDGGLDAQSSAALKVWFADAAGKVPSGWFAPASAPPPEKKQEQQQTPPQTCKPGEVWDEVNKACQPLPTGMTVPDEPPAGGSNTTALLLLAGGVVLAGGLLWWMSKQGGLVGAGDVQDNPAPVEITRRAINKLGDKLGFEWLVFRGSPNWLAYGRQNPSTVSLTVRPGANEGYIVTLRVTPERKSLTPYDRSRFREQAVPSIVVIEGKSLGTRAEAWEQAAHLASALISKHRRWYNENPSFYISEIGYGTRAAANEAARRLRAQKTAYRVHVFSEKEHADADTNYIVKSWYHSEAAKQESVKRLINSYRTRPFRENPSGYRVHVVGKRETYGPYTSLQRAKTFARIGAQHGKHDRTVVKDGRVVRHYRAGTGESLIH